jgi:hypothetical protein
MKKTLFVEIFTKIPLPGWVSPISEFVAGGFKFFHEVYTRYPGRVPPHPHSFREKGHVS